MGEVRNKENLRLCFESKREFLRVPVEFLFDDLSSGGDYLVLQLPFTRVVHQVRVKKKPISPIFLNDLWRDKRFLNILLVASNTGSIPCVDDEITSVKNIFEERFKDLGIPIKIKMILTEDSCYESIRQELKTSEYHIFHYAGHGNYNEKTPEKSVLSFWQEPDRKGGIKEMKASELQLLIRESELRFVFLSCCQGTTSGDNSKLLNDDFLGIADSIIHAGVPSVLGYRWPVSDSGAKKLAIAFYESLSQHGWIDRALLDARCEVASRNRDDITWLSPILINQV